MSFANVQELDWDDLRVFNAVVQAGSLRGASIALGINHSTVFRRLNRLEKAIGARLFDRLPEGYALTQAGDELAPYAARIGEQVDALSLSLLGKDFKPGGTVRITAPDNIAYTFLPGYIDAFLDDYPDIRVELVAGGASLDLTRREADIAIRATPKPPDYLIARKVCRLAWAFYASPAYLDARGHPGDINDLAEQRMIGADGALEKLPAMRWLDKRLSDRIVVRCNTLDGMSALAEAGLGIALMPDDQFKPTLERLFEARPRVVSDLWLLTHPELRRTERVRLMVEHLMAKMREDPRLASHEAAD